MGEREITPGAPDTASLLNEFTTKKTNYLRDAFAKNRMLRSLYKSIATNILSSLANNIITMSAEQKTIHKDIIYFNNLITLDERRPPLPTIIYSGPTTTLGGKEIPQMPVFVFSTPTIEIETAAASALASIILIQIAKDSPAASPDFENAFAKYYRFEIIGVTQGGSTPLGINATLSSLAAEAAVNLSSTDPFTADQRISLTRVIYSTTGEEILAVNNFIYLGSIRTQLQSLAAAATQIDLPAVLMRFEAIASSSTYLSHFRGIRLISTTCRGTEVSETRIIGSILIIRHIGFAGTIICR